MISVVDDMICMMMVIMVSWLGKWINIFDSIIEIEDAGGIDDIDVGGIGEIVVYIDDIASIGDVGGVSLVVLIMLMILRLWHMSSHSVSPSSC